MDDDGVGRRGNGVVVFVFSWLKSCEFDYGKLGVGEGMRKQGSCVYMVVVL